METLCCNTKLTKPCKGIRFTEYLASCSNSSRANTPLLSRNRRLGMPGGAIRTQLNIATA